MICICLNVRIAIEITFQCIETDKNEIGQIGQPAVRFYLWYEAVSEMKYAMMPVNQQIKRK